MSEQCPLCSECWPPEGTPIGDYSIRCRGCGREYVVQQRRRFPAVHPASWQERVEDFRRLAGPVVASASEEA